MDEALDIALRTAREDTDVYGPRYSKKRLVWKVLGAEEVEDSFQVRLAYRPARRFRGEPGEELLSIDRRVGTTEFRRLVKEPLEKRWIPIPLLAIGLPAIIGTVVAGGLFATNALAPEDPGLVLVSVPISPDAPAQLSTPAGDVTVDLEIGAVSEPVELAYQSVSVSDAPDAPEGFVLSETVFDLSVSSKKAAAGEPFSFTKPITVTVQLSDQDIGLANGDDSSIVIHHYVSDSAGWNPLPTTVDFVSKTAAAPVDSLSIFALSIRKPGTAPPTAEPPEAATGVLEIRVTDAPPEGVTRIDVTVSEIQVHKGDIEDEEEGWITVIEEEKTFDLVKLTGVEEVLGAEIFAAGKYTQIRMDIDEVIVTHQGEDKEATLPGDKLKVIRPFDVTAGEATILTLDFDAARSLVVTGQGGIKFSPVLQLVVRKEPRVAPPISEALDVATTTATATPTATTAPPPLTGKIAFTSNRDGIGEIYVMNADGSNQTNITNNAATDNSPDWSPASTPPPSASLAHDRPPIAKTQPASGVLRGLIGLTGLMAAFWVWRLRGPVAAGRRK